MGPKLGGPTSLSLLPMCPTQPVLLAPGKDAHDDALFLTSTPVDVSRPFEYSGHGERVHVDELSFAYAPSAPSFFIHEHPCSVVIAQPEATVASCNWSIRTSENAATDFLASNVVGSYRKEVCAKKVHSAKVSRVTSYSLFLHVRCPQRSICISHTVLT